MDADADTEEVAIPKEDAVRDVSQEEVAGIIMDITCQHNQGTIKIPKSSHNGA